MISSADLPLNFGCGSTGMPRPLSRTLTVPSLARSISMRLACPATASSMALSSASATKWCSARSSVPPMYMPGRRRTGSRPSSTSMSLAVYGWAATRAALWKRSAMADIMGTVRRGRKAHAVAGTMPLHKM
jgi:hypothetical protein